MTRIPILWLSLAVLACAGAEPSAEDREACMAAGHSPGTEAFQACLDARLAARFARPAGEAVDDLRTRMGPP